MPEPATSPWQPIEYTNFAHNTIAPYNINSISHHGDGDSNGEIRGVEGVCMLRSSTSQGPTTANPPERQAITEQVSKPRRKQTSCPLCARSMLKRVLPRHLRTVHRTQPNHLSLGFSCLQCGEVFARKDILERHRAEQHVNKSSAVTCPGCGLQIRMRAFESHIKSQKCQKAQLQADLTFFASRKEALAASLKDPGRFGSSTTIDPLLAALHFQYETFKYMLYEETPPHQVSVKLLQSYGLAMRATFRALNDPIEVGYSIIACALHNLCTGENFTSLRGTSIVILKTILALEQYCGCTLLDGSLFRSGAVGRNMIESVFTQGEIDEVVYEEFVNILDHDWPVVRLHIMAKFQMVPT